MVQSQLFRREVHTHTDLSDGNGSPEDNLEVARSHLGFWAMADRAYDEVAFSLDYRQLRQRQAQRQVRGCPRPRGADHP